MRKRTIAVVRTGRQTTTRRLVRRDHAVPRLAIIISAVGSIEALENTLVSVLENRPADCDVVVVHSKPYSDPYELKNEVRFVSAPRGSGRLVCAKLGIAETTAPLVHLLDAGCTVSEGWCELAVAYFHNPRVGAVSPAIYASDAPDELIAAGVEPTRGGQRRLVSALPAVEKNTTSIAVHGPLACAAFYRRAAIEKAGGLPTACGNTQFDVELATLIRLVGYTAFCEPKARVFSPRLAASGSRGLREAMYAERRFWRNAPQAGWSSAIVAHLALIVWEAVTSFPRPRMITQLVGRLIGCCQMGNYARHRAWLETLDKTVPTLPVRPAGERLRMDRSHQGFAKSENNETRVKAG